MALDSKQRKLLHQKGQKPITGKGSPSKSDGKDGDIAYKDIQGQGTVHFVKAKGEWKPLSSSGSMPATRTIIGGTSRRTSSGITSHGDLTGLTDNDHTQYLTTPGDGIDVTGQTVAVDVTDILGTGLTESSNNIDVVYEADNPITINAGDVVAPVGAADEASRGDHQHPVSTGTPNNLSVNLAASTEGSASSLARSDHTHDLDESIAPTWTGLHKFDEKIEVNRGGSSYKTDYAINREPESNGRHFASGEADYQQNYSWLGVYDQISDYDTGYGDW